jgi:uncharacterized protein (TIGR02231 family)
MPELLSQIVAVTVFPDRARVTRRGQAAVTAGVQRLEVSNLPAGLLPESVRVAARGTVRAKLLGVDARKTFLREVPEARVRDLETRLQALEDEDKTWADRAETLAKQLTHLDGLADATGTFARGLATGTASVESQAALLAFLARERGETQAAVRQISAERRRLSRDLEQVRNELQQLRNARPRERYAVAVEVEADAAGELELDLIYLLPGAKWTPIYDIRLLDGALEITYLGEVTQTTGEDWTGVTLTLSTARPAQTSSLPTLKPWYVSGQAPAPEAAMRSSLPAEDRKMRAMWTGAAETLAASAAPEAVEAEVGVARVEQTESSVTFQIAGTVDVPSDNSPRKATVGIFRLPPKFDYVTVPKLAESVYRRALVTNASPYPLLPGRAQLFVGEDFLGTANLGLIVPNQEVELFFGTDDRMRVERALVQRDVSKKLMSGRRRVHYAYEIRFFNHTPAPQNLTVVDQIPVAQHEDIKVVLGEVEPRATRGDDLNRLIWKFQLPAGGKDRIRFDFAVEYPPNLRVYGLA